MTKTMLRSLGVLSLMLAALFARTPAHADGSGPFAGVWSGSFSNSAGVSGTIDATISPTGVLRGILVQPGSAGALHGRLRGDGFLAAVLVQESDPARPYLGAAWVDDNGHLVGTFVIRGTPITGEFDLAPL